MQKVVFLKSKLKPAKINVPGSKSASIRALFIAALGKGTTKIYNTGFCDDVDHFINGLKELGVKIISTKKHLEVHGKGGKFKNPQKPLFVGNSGLALRFFTALNLPAKFRISLSGDERTKKRPVKDLEKSIKEFKSKESGCFKISGGKSSQFISALLIIAPLLNKNIEIVTTGKIVSKPYIDMTMEMMRDFGVKVENKNYKKFIIKAGQKYNRGSYKVGGDTTNAVYFAAISSLHNINITTIQPEIDIKKIKFGKKNDLNDYPDSAMTVAILAALNKGKTKVINVENLKHKECDRIKATINGLKKLNIQCRELKDGFEITGTKGQHKKINKNALIESYNDHRIVMSFAVLGTKLPGLQILNPDCVSKSYPGFFDDLKKTGAKFAIQNIPNIILTGMRGSGKTTIGKIIADKLKYQFIDIDEQIEKHEKMTISKMVKQFGWAYFRKKEHEAIKQIYKLKNIVVAAGGGAITDERNIELLKKIGKIIFLKCPLKTLERRIKNNMRGRPPLTKEAQIKHEIKKIWDERKDKYRSTADLTIDSSDNLSLNKIAETIILKI